LLTVIKKSLVTHLAHDLGPDYEPYFEQTLKLLTSLTSMDNLDVIQWAFSALAYLFKYLSRLLVTDLRPTYDLLSPYLGKTRQKPFVTRFTAESLSFLIRKCSGESLTSILSRIFEDVMADISQVNYLKTTVLLLADSVKSTGNNLHSKNGVILTEIFKISCSHDDQNSASEFVSGILVEILHHTRKETAQDLYKMVYEFCDKTLNDGREKIPSTLLSNILFVLAGHRMGSRVEDWDPLYEHSIALLTASSHHKAGKNNSFTVATLNLSLALLQNAEFRSTTKFYRKLFQTLQEIYETSEFLSFANLLLTYSKDVFKTFMLPYVETYVKSMSIGGNMLPIAYFAIQLKRESFAKSFLSNTLFKESLHDFFKTQLEGSNVESFESMWWSLELYEVVAPDSQFIKDVIVKLLSKIMIELQQEENIGVRASLIGKMLNIISTLEEPHTLQSVLEQLISRIPLLLESCQFLYGLHNIFSSIER
jgi:U3 small nucleolar RNA-associated protein 20